MERASLLGRHARSLHARRQSQPLVPVPFGPDSLAALQNKAQNIILGTYRMPGQEGNIVGVPSQTEMPLFRRQVLKGSARPTMQARLFHAEKVDDVHLDSPYESYYPVDLIVP